MDLETKFKKESGFDAYADNDLRPKVPSDYYVEWLENKLTLTDVSQQRELLLAYESYSANKIVGKEDERVSKQLVEDFLANNFGSC